MHVHDLTDTQRTFVEVVYGGFRARSDWPTTSYVDAVLDHDYELDYEALVSEFPRSVVIAEPGYGQQSFVKVTVAGLRSVSDATTDLGRFVSLVRAAADLERSVRPGPDAATQPELGSGDGDEIWGGSLEKDALTRVLEIAKLEGIAAGFRGPGHTGDWSMGIGRWIRAYRGVRDVDDYLVRHPEPLSQTWSPPPPSTPYVFILMPFGKPWSGDVEATMRFACRQVSKRFTGLHWERADKITETGRITDQIVTAIERADVLIADVTGTNPNVLFELGYADALGKSVIVLNQLVSETPFDIKDWRQIEYSLDDLPALSARLSDFLAASLRRQQFQEQVKTTEPGREEFF